MRNRILELAQESYTTSVEVKNLTDVFDGSYIVSPKQLERFAEVIIRECVWKIYNHPELYRDPIYKFEILLSDTKRHFGLEE